MQLKNCKQIYPHLRGFRQIHLSVHYKVSTYRVCQLLKSHSKKRFARGWEPHYRIFFCLLSIWMELRRACLMWRAIIIIHQDTYKKYDSIVSDLLEPESKEKEKSKENLTILRISFKSHWFCNLSQSNNKNCCQKFGYLWNSALKV